MKKQITVFLGLILALSSAAIAQTKTVTNSDLEKFRQKRLQSERQYRENYERLGFPSPEELERKRIEDEKNLIEYSQTVGSSKIRARSLTDGSGKRNSPLAESISAIAVLQFRLSNGRLCSRLFALLRLL